MVRGSASRSVLVIIPTHNEAPNVGLLLDRIFGLRRALDVLVVDDLSTDDTLDRLRAHAQYGKRLRVIERTRKEGIGGAYVSGFSYALSHQYDYVIQMDADLSHNPSDIPRLLSACEMKGYDMAIGSRYVSGVNVVNWPMSRVLLSYFASRYVRFITGLPIHDTTAGFACYKTSLLRLIMADPPRFAGYAFQIEMKYYAWKHKARMVELSVIFTERIHGKSKMSMGIFREAFIGVLRLRLESVWRRYPALVSSSASDGQSKTATTKTRLPGKAL